MRTSRFILFSLLVSACAEPESTTVSTAGDIIDHGDGTYSYRAPADLLPAMTKREGAVTWTYIGQARHSWDPKPMTTLRYVVPDADAQLARENVLGMVRTEADGSRWRATAVDEAMMRDVFARRDARSIEVARGLTREDPARPRTAAPVELVGKEITVQASSWTGSSCDNHYYMGDDDRVRVDGDSSSRRKAMVDVRISGATSCSGVILRSQWVLTAAHCIFDSNHNQIDESFITVARWDGVDATPIYNVSETFIDENFTSPGTDPKDDWALLKLSTSLQSPFVDMDISGASDSTLEALTGVINLAFPGFAPNCSDNVNGSIVDDMWLNDVGDLGAIYNQKVNLKIDGGPGHSGSPVFYCPDGDNNVCAGSEKGFVIAVWSGWNGFETTFVGAKGANFRDRATLIMDTE